MNMGVYIFDDDPLGKCPGCGYQDVIEHFDTIGACDDQIFCPRCHTEFNFDTGIKHERCKQCEAIEAGCLSPPVTPFWDGQQTYHFP